MRVIRTLYVSVSLALIMAVVQGCGLLPSRMETLNALAAKEQKENLETTKNLLDCFSNKNAEGLKELLCKRTQDLADIDEQIFAGFDFFAGRVVSFNENQLSDTGSSSEENGRITRLERSWSIHDITTDTLDVESADKLRYR